jgi:hypothetical protein
MPPPMAHDLARRQTDVRKPPAAGFVLEGGVSGTAGSVCLGLPPLYTKIEALISHQLSPIAVTASFDQQAYVVGASFDEAKPPAYERTLASRLQFAELYPRLIDQRRRNTGVPSRQRPFETARMSAF